MLIHETWPVEKLVEYARNPRKNDHAVDRVAAAIREFGFRVPVVAKSDGTVVDGHLRLKAAKKLGKTHQNILVFVKGDGKRAAKACGDVEISDDCFAGVAGAEGVDAAELEGV